MLLLPMRFAAILVHSANPTRILLQMDIFRIFCCSSEGPFSLYRRECFFRWQYLHRFSSLTLTDVDRAPFTVIIGPPHTDGHTLLSYPTSTPNRSHATPPPQVSPVPKMVGNASLTISPVKSTVNPFIQLINRIPVPKTRISSPALRIIL